MCLSLLVLDLACRDRRVCCRFGTGLASGHVKLVLNGDGQASGELDTGVISVGRVLVCGGLFKHVLPDYLRLADHALVLSDFIDIEGLHEVVSIVDV